jgi:hypothetical protein
MPFFTSDKARIFRITHADNMAWSIANGLQCRNSQLNDPNFVEIGNPELIGKRSVRTLPEPPGGTLSDYVPFYFTPFSPMLLNIKTGYNGSPKSRINDIVILLSSLHTLLEQGIPFSFSDRHAYLKTANFSSNIEDLANLAWDLWERRDFKRDPENPEKVEKYQAEALVKGALPMTAINGILCHSAERMAQVKALIDSNGNNTQVLVKPELFFK